jgi:imidazoleglycerol-phosphate dehydratase
MTSGEQMSDRNRTTRIERITAETSVIVEINGDGNGAIDTTIPFLDHMMTALARYGGIGLVVNATGDLRHHILEDVAICVGLAIRDCAPAGRARYGDRTIPMDDALVHCAIDLGGRAYYAGRLPSSLYQHWMRSFAENARATLHLRVLRGRDRHHIIEASFKALGLALRDAFADTGSIRSTKGMLQESRPR